MTEHARVTTAHMPAAHTTATAAPARVDLTRTALARAAAVLAIASAGVHLLLVNSSSLGTAVMAAMALACLPCAWHLWRSPSGAVWAMTAGVDAGMLAVHAPMLATPSHHGVGTPTSLMWLGVALVIAQLVLAAAAAVRR
jgi:hypothetical protein